MAKWEEDRWHRYNIDIELRTKTLSKILTLLEEIEIPKIKKSTAI